MLDALGDHRFADLPRLTASPTQLRQRIEAELDRALAQLRVISQEYWDRDWRGEHRGGGRYPENHLWDAVDGYLNLLDAARQSPTD